MEASFRFLQRYPIIIEINTRYIDHMGHLCWIEYFIVTGVSQYNIEDF